MFKLDAFHCFACPIFLIIITWHDGRMTVGLVFGFNKIACSTGTWLAPIIFMRVQLAIVTAAPELLVTHRALIDMHRLGKAMALAA